MPWVFSQRYRSLHVTSFRVDLVRKLINMRGMRHGKQHLSLTSSKSQYFLFRTLQDLFPRDEVLLDYLHTDLVNPSTYKAMEVDVFIPSLSLGFEYQGRQHYEETGFRLLSLKKQRNRDEIKKTLCSKRGITCIT